MSSNHLESAISPCLRQLRSTSVQLPPNHAPPYAAYTSRFPTSTSHVVVTILGIQYRPTVSSPSFPTPEYTKIVSFLDKPTNSTPNFWEPSSFTDSRGYYHILVIIYWSSISKFQEWRSASGFQLWWANLEPSPECGHFLEMFTPTMDRYEDVTSRMDIQEGGAHMRECMSGPIQEHAYWGSMRDRLPVSQVDQLHGEKNNMISINDNTIAKSTEKAETSRGRIKVPSRKNLCVIRSGQDWSSTSPEERALYLSTMHPVLITGMNFLRDEGSEIGCHSCRFADIIDPMTGKADKERTFGLAYFNELASLEDWSRKHQTHLNIFGGFLKYAKRLGDDMTLKLWHEVCVLEEDQQEFEYVGCHSQTGMLATL
ncbi:phenylacetaldoxime dehydratase [Corynespora cassiicola Philippines]|uniref:Phenylacetaldoxime dehydratase n=1 Tax=Corynespora cassiicola Philippines TaxID=1448308 RepID=A0A2T2P9M6_CORCC|nr:phenylacetaldoxime dehydratase [Corynespora cassiicola Philippines]